MSMAYRSIFKRREMKFMLSPDKYSEFRKLISPYMSEDSYGLHTICSIYFDTDDNRIIRTSLEKPEYKEKLRLRSYGIPRSGSQTVFLELKKKYKKIVYKRRIQTTLDKANGYIRTGRLDDSSQIFSEIDYFRKFYNAYPKLFVGYDRIAMFGKEDPELRMTFDFRIRCRRENLDLKCGDHGTYIIPDGYALLEIKIAKAMPIWLSDILTQLDIYPVSFSKYGTFYKKEMRGELSICSQVS